MFPSDLYVKDHTENRVKTHDFSVNCTRKTSGNLHDLSCDSHENPYGYARENRVEIHDFSCK